MAAINTHDLLLSRLDNCTHMPRRHCCTSTTRQMTCVKQGVHRHCSGPQLRVGSGWVEMLPSQASSERK